MKTSIKGRIIEALDAMANGARFNKRSLAIATGNLLKRPLTVVEEKKMMDFVHRNQRLYYKQPKSQWYVRNDVKAADTVKMRGTSKSRSGPSGQLYADVKALKKRVNALERALGIAYAHE